MIPFGYLIGVGAAAVGAAFSARWNWWRRSNAGIPILMYHKIGTPPPGSKMGSLWVSQEKFKKQMSYLSEEGYHPVTFKDLYDHWDGKKPLPLKPVFITFDDGYSNNFTEAFPILKEFGFRATLFVVVQTVGWDNHWHDPVSETRIPMVSWAQLKELQGAGWEIGSHTMSHPRLAKLPIPEVKEEMSKSRRIISEFLDEIPDTFAYPYGNGEDVMEIRECAKEAGYRVAVGIHSGKWTLDEIKKNPFNLPRIFVRGDDLMFDFHLQMTRGRSRL